MERASKNFIIELKKQKRENKSLLFLDNIKIIKDAISNGDIDVKYILTSLSEEEFEKTHLEKILIDFQSQKTNIDIDENQNKNSNFEIKIFKVEEKTLEQLATTKTPQKVLCIAYHQQYVVESPKTNFLVLDGLQDPGNVGTLIRTAKATGFETVFLIDSVKRTNEKLIRSSVGAVLSNKVYEMTRQEFVSYAKTNKFNLLCCDMKGENIFTYKTTEAIVGVVIGNEGQGVSDELRKICCKTIKIPMKEGIESLNAGVSGSLIMYELAKKQFV